ncbi:MAG: hypothetical protein JJ992_14180 [Planctomycetes bacterium]|nr:hypothetical protein [Planctomycetota bacterium]
MIDPKKHSEQRGIVESILRYIPGFRGYLEKDYRQESDRLARQAMADRLQEGKQALDHFMLKLVNAGQLDPLTDCERVKTRIDSLILKMRSAVRGYSGFFDYVRVDEDLLDQVYENDMALIQDVEGLAATIEQLAAKPDPATTSIDDILGRIEDIDRKFARRGQLLNGLGS